MSPENSLGPLEADIMQIVWVRQRVSVQDVHEALCEKRPIAYNTVMTVMTRLAQKGILKRQKEGRAFIYTSTTSKSEVAKNMLQYIIDKIFGGSRAPVFSHLLEDKTLSDEELQYLEELVREKKKEE